MEESYIYKDATLKCIWGTKEAKLGVQEFHGVHRVKGYEKYPVVNMNDHTNQINIRDFGRCNCPINPMFLAEYPIPQEAAAMVAENLVTQAGLCECVPLLPAPWITTSVTTNTDMPTLNDKSICVCAMGFGTISIKDVPKMGEISLSNTGLSYKGNPLPDHVKAINEKFRGDQFKPEDSFDASIDPTDHDAMVAANYASSCGIGENIEYIFNEKGDKVPKNYPQQDNDIFLDKMTQKEKDNLEKVRASRENVPPIEKDTIVQKAITLAQLDQFLVPATGEKKPNTFLTGCISRACDVAPFVACDADSYDQLRLDFPATPYLDSSINLRDGRVDRLDKDGNKVQRNNPGRVDKKNNRTFVVRANVKNKIPANNDIPLMDGKSWNNPPCTGTGYVSGTEHLIPEYNCSYDQEAKKRTEIADGAIFAIDADGNETIVAYWNQKEGCFIQVDDGDIGMYKGE